MQTAKKESPEERAPKKPAKPRKKKVQTLAEWLFEDMSPKAFQKLEIECGVYPGKDDLLFKKLAAMNKQASRKRTIEVRQPGIPFVDERGKKVYLQPKVDEDGLWFSSAKLEIISIDDLLKGTETPGVNDWNPYFGLKATPPPIPMTESVKQFKFKR
jgi:hypothetical protein